MICRVTFLPINQPYSVLQQVFQTDIAPYLFCWSTAGAICGGTLSLLQVEMTFDSDRLGGGRSNLETVQRSSRRQREQNLLITLQRCRRTLDPAEIPMRTDLEVQTLQKKEMRGPPAPQTTARPDQRRRGGQRRGQLRAGAMETGSAAVRDDRRLNDATRSLV